MELIAKGELVDEYGDVHYTGETSKLYSKECLQNHTHKWYGSRVIIPEMGLIRDLYYCRHCRAIHVIKFKQGVVEVTRDIEVIRPLEEEASLLELCD